MDVTETYAAKAGITSGVNVALVGRWFLGLLRGQITHTNILDSKSSPHEVKTGWAFHFLVGGGCVALLYPVFFQATGFPHPAITCLADCYSVLLLHRCLGSFFSPHSAGAFSGEADLKAQMPYLQVCCPIFLMVLGLE